MPLLLSAVSSRSSSRSSPALSCTFSCPPEPGGSWVTGTGITRTPPPPFAFHIDHTPLPRGRGVSVIPLPPFAGRDPPLPGLGRVTLPSLRRRSGPEKPCNNARLPFLRWGVSGIPPPHVTLQTDHTPHPWPGGVGERPPAATGNCAKRGAAGRSYCCGFTSGGPADGGAQGRDRLAGGVRETPPIGAKLGGALVREN